MNLVSLWGFPPVCMFARDHFTATGRLQLVQAFIEAKQLLEDGRQESISTALSASQCPNWRLARLIVEARVYFGPGSRGPWIFSRDLSGPPPTSKDLRDYRLRWLDSLIAEFSA